jgi:hypothetical protein
MDRPAVTAAAGARSVSPRTEAELLDATIDLATRTGWAVHHDRPARRAGTSWATAHLRPRRLPRPRPRPPRRGPVPRLKGYQATAASAGCQRPSSATGDATWHAIRVEPGSGSDKNRVDLTVECVSCDRPWSLGQQLARRLERIRNAVIERTAA